MKYVSYRTNHLRVCRPGRLLALSGFFLFFFGGHCPAACAQNRQTVSGYVRDLANGEVLIGVTVSVDHRTVGTVTNNYGFYSLNLPPGTYTLRFSFVGFTSRELAVTLGETPVRQNVELSAAATQLQEVSVRALPDSASAGVSALWTNALKSQTIRQMPALFGEADVIRSIQLLPGITTVGEGASGFNVRGGNVDQNLILLDEAPVYNSAHLFGFFFIFNPDAVKDIRLMKGGIPVSYGGRISSILDVRLKEGNSRKQSVSGGIGSIFSRLTYEQPLAGGRGSFIVAARRSYLDILARPFLREELSGSRFYFYDLTAKANLRVNAANTLYLSGYLGRDVFGAGFGLNWGNATATARWNRVFNEKLFLNLTLYKTAYDYGFNSDAQKQQDGFRWQSNIDTHSLKPDFTYYLMPGHTLSFGGQYIRYNTTPGRASITSNQDEKIYLLERQIADELAFYVGNEHVVNERLSLSYGIRYSLFRNRAPGSYYQFEPAGPGQRRPVILPAVQQQSGILHQYGNWEPRFTGSWKLLDKGSLKLGYQRMVQYLHLLSNTAAASPVDVWRLSSPNLRPQRSDQFTAGWVQQIEPGGYEVSLEGYYKLLHNQIDYVKGANLLLNPYVEGDLLAGKGRAYGVEALVRKQKGRFTGWLSYTLSRTERRIAGLNNDRWFVSRFDRTHVLNVVTQYPFSKRVSGSATFTLTSGAPVTLPTSRWEWAGWALPYQEGDRRNTARMPPTHRLDLSLTWQTKKAPFHGRGEWVASLYNAYNRRNAFSVYTRQTENDNLQTEAVRFSVIGSVVPALTYNFNF
ncbi:TonB-dependent receptor [Larkinella knui]|uniref:TonB-dependent receptor n=1 Tax=Larkinella knui TaxID=2025310 RepID=A0A3P1CKP4_9BACT|nr:TonB-dependent receptor [Larkinella knui]RRB13887.1 TonB-dependent receptor [Larkinella knui]